MGQPPIHESQIPASANPEFWGLSALGWQACSTVVAVAAFIVALIVGYVQLRSARKTRLEQSRPYVVVDLVPGLASSKLLDLVITNIGVTPAYDLLVTFDPAPEHAREDFPQFKLKDSRILNERTPMVTPGREFRMFFDSAPERYASELSTARESRLPLTTCGRRLRIASGERPDGLKFEQYVP